MISNKLAINTSWLCNTSFSSWEAHAWNKVFIAYRRMLLVVEASFVVLLASQSRKQAMIY